MYVLDIFIIAIIITYCIDVSGAWNGISSAIVRWATNGRKDHPIEIKPFSCSQCMTFWCGLGYLLFTNQFSMVSLLVVCIASYLTINIAQLFDLINRVITKLYNYAKNHLK